MRNIYIFAFSSWTKSMNLFHCSQIILGLFFCVALLSSVCFAQKESRCLAARWSTQCDYILSKRCNQFEGATTTTTTKKPKRNKEVANSIFQWDYNLLRCDSEYAFANKNYTHFELIHERMRQRRRWRRRKKKRVETKTKQNEKRKKYRLNSQ